MESTIWFTDGFVVITGEIGAGKTTLIETFLQELDKDVVVAQINQTQITPTGFLQGLLVQFGFSPFKMNKAELLATLNNFLIEQYAAGRKVLLIIDEAQNLCQPGARGGAASSPASRPPRRRRCRIILAGQPELNDKLDSPEMRQLAQRIRLRFHLTPLTREDCNAYIVHRLEIAGAAGRQIFSDGTLALVLPLHRRRAAPHQHALRHGDDGSFAADSDTVDEAEVKSAIDELQWVEYAARTNRMQRAEMVVPVLRHVSPDTVLGRVYVATDGNTVGETDLKIGRLLVGRTPDNDLQIDSEVRQPPPLPDHDRARGLRGRGPQQHQRHRLQRQARAPAQLLNDGDVIVIGQHELMYVDERPSTPRGPSDAGAADPNATGSHEALTGAAAPEAGSGPH